MSSEMSMMENGDMSVGWRCSACDSFIKDRKGFEKKVKECPKCKEKVTAFHGLYDEDEDDVE